MDKEMGRLSIVIPLVIYHGKPYLRIPSSLGMMLSGYEEISDDLKVYAPNFDYLLYDVSTYTDEEIKWIAQTKISLTLMRDIFTTDTAKLLQSFYRSVHYLNELEDRQTGIEYFETMIRYLLGSAKQLTKSDMENMMRELEKVFPEGSDLTMTLADIIREEGLQQGKTKAMSQIANQQLFRKFGNIPGDIKESIATADSAALQLLLTDIFSLESVEQIRKYLQ